MNWNATTEENIKTNSHRWLVVDDDACVLELTSEVLRSVPGSDVVACNDSRTALEVFFAEPEAFELVVTDFNMPGMDGLQFAHAIHERSPQTRVVMITGSDLENADGRRGELQALLPKPYAPTALLAAVRWVLTPSEMCLVRDSGGPGRKSVCRPVLPDFPSTSTTNM
jgi:CheY-like chemotaxis protein